MAVQLAEMGAADEFHPENYRDEVAERVRAMIQKKIEGEEITSVDAEEPRAQVIDLMEALKASLASPRPRGVKRIALKAEQNRKPAKAAPPKTAAKRASR
jgi:DNA end-binding protein Ku